MVEGRAVLAFVLGSSGGRECCRDYSEINWGRGNKGLTKASRTKTPVAESSSVLVWTQMTMGGSA